MKLFTKLTLAVALIGSSLVSMGAPADSDKQIYKKVDALMKKMTLQEKIGQLQQISSR